MKQITVKIIFIGKNKLISIHTTCVSFVVCGHSGMGVDQCGTGARPPTFQLGGDATWYGMVWYGMVWYGMVWYGMVWYGMVWYGMVWYGMVWYGMVWYGVYSFNISVHCT